MSKDSDTGGPRTTWHGIIGTGQSLSVGFQGDLFEPTSAAPGGLKLYDKDNKSGGKSDAPSLQAIPLTEPIRPIPKFGAKFYPDNIAGLSPHHGMTCAIDQLIAGNENVAKPYVTAHTVVGSGGATMQVIRKDGDSNAYKASMFEAKAFQRLAEEQGCDLVYDAIVLTHGESDAVLNNEKYAEEVMKMQKDYAEDLKIITGQTKDPVLILSQVCCCKCIAKGMTKVLLTMDSKIPAHQLASSCIP